MEDFIQNLVLHRHPGLTLTLASLWHTRVPFLTRLWKHVAGPFLHSLSEAFTSGGGSHHRQYRGYTALEGGRPQSGAGRHQASARSWTAAERHTRGQRQGVRSSAGEAGGRASQEKVRR